MNGKIGLFDSGIGGYTILRAVRTLLPHYDYVYYADTEHVPYGDRTEEEVFALTKTGVETLFHEGSEIVLVACNTASAETLRKLQDTLIPDIYGYRRILGVIIPTVETLIEHKTQNALLIGTRRTIESHKYERELQKRNYAGTFTAVATPRLVPLLENESRDEAVAYLDGVLSAGVGQYDTIVLGCTHYALLKRDIRHRYSNKEVISQDEIIPEKLSGYLARHDEIKSKLTQNGTEKIILTKDGIEYRKKLDAISVEGTT